LKSQGTGILTARNDNIAFRRLIFILTEIVNDLGIQKASFSRNLGTVVLALCILWCRMFIHYLGQYLILKFIKAPVMSLTFNWYKMHLDYANWNVYQEMGVIACGPLSNTLIFSFWAVVCYYSDKYIFCFPVYFCKILAWYGLFTVLDFILIVVVDAAFMDNNGDLWKLYNYY